MAISRAAAAGGIFPPEHLEILQRVFEQACLERGYPRDGLEAEELATLIVELFQGGIVSEADLRVALSRKN
jgi:hypothetical protein